MWPPLYVLLTWVLTIVLEISVIVFSWRRRIVYSYPSFAVFITVMALLDILLALSLPQQTFAIAVDSVREVARLVLRTWVIVELCRSGLARYHRTRWLATAILLASAAVMLLVSVPALRGGLLFTPQMARLEWLVHISHLTQLGVIAMLFLLASSTQVGMGTQEIVLATGLAAGGAADLIAAAMHFEHSPEAPVAIVTLVGTIASSAIWLFFLSPRLNADEDDTSAIREIAMGSHNGR